METQKDEITEFVPKYRQLLLDRGYDQDELPNGLPISTINAIRSLEKFLDEYEVPTKENKSVFVNKSLQKCKETDEKICKAINDFLDGEHDDDDDDGEDSEEKEQLLISVLIFDVLDTFFKAGKTKVTKKELLEKNIPEKYIRNLIIKSEQVTYELKKVSGLFNSNFVIIKKMPKLKK